MKVFVQGNRVADVGVFRRQDFDLKEVTAALWQMRGRSRRPRLLVGTPFGWVPFDFRVHRNEDARQLIQFFRHGLSPEIQEGWTPEWKELAVLFDSTRALRDPLSWSKFVRACLLGGVGAGLICGVIAHFMLADLPAATFSWSGSFLADWTVYGLALGLGFSVPLMAAALLDRCGRWLDA